MTQNGPVLTSGPDGTQVTYRGRRLYPRRPVADTRKRARRIGAQRESLCIIPSPLLGYGVDELRASLHETSELLFVESDPALLALSAAYTTIDVYSLSGARENALGRTDQWFRRFRRVVTVSLNGGYALNSKAYQELEQLVRRRLQRAWQNKITTINMGRLWVSNTIRNLPLIESSRDIEDLKTDKPVAVLGAGPTLDRRISELREHRSSLYVVAVDTALRALVSHDIRPDLVCVLEAQHANLDDVTGTGIGDQSVCADISSYPGLLRRCRPENLYLYSTTFGENSLLSQLESRGIRPAAVPPLGSVGAAVAIAQRLTDGPILLFGLDFAFDHGKTHARGTPRHLRDLRVIGRLTGSDPAPFSLSARTSPVTDTTSPLSLTTSELVTYNRVTAELCRSGNVYDFTAAPLPLGRRDLSCADVIERADHTVSRNIARQDGSRVKRSTHDRTKAFIQDEIEKLNMLQSLLLSGKWEESTNLLQMLSYLTIDFPDADRVERAAATRLLAACSFYRCRWEWALGMLGTHATADRKTDRTNPPST